MNREIAIGALALLTFIQVANAQTVQIEDVRVQLFHEDKGELSFDLTKKKDLALWNTIIGEGESGGPATSFLVSVVLRSKPGTHVKQQVVVVVTDDRKKTKVMERRFASLLFANDGRLVKPVFVENRTCAPTTISVSVGTSSRQVNLPFECGE